MEEPKLADLVTQIRSLEVRLRRLQRSALISIALVILGVLFIGIVRPTLRYPGTISIERLIAVSANGKGRIEIHANEISSDISLQHGEETQLVHLMASESVSRVQVSRGEMRESADLAAEDSGPTGLYLRSGKGQAVARLRMESHGGGSMSMDGLDGSRRITLGVAGRGSAVLNMSGTGKEDGLSVMADEKGETSLIILGPDGKGGAGIAADSGGPRINLVDKQLKKRLGLLLQDDRPALRLMDESEKDRLVLGLFGNGTHSLSCRDEDGNERASFGLPDGKNPGVVLIGEDGKQSIAMCLYETGLGALVFKGIGGALKISLGTDNDHSALSFKDGAGVGRAGIIVQDQGKERIKLSDSEGKEVWSAPPEPGK